ncbi:hypothetical protein SLEP1_g58457 [Rubroshorea leprosula]|uniref:Uncharacterized protein n=1 Tax=Rubroshorea leprosula TaxID=152421 RepID=A0AAV5MPC0_9ROSI|nr:hypothetical protein SLEP1_g58457 [Rubroshorea leprosula]
MSALFYSAECFVMDLEALQLLELQHMKNMFSAKWLS